MFKFASLYYYSKRFHSSTIYSTYTLCFNWSVAISTQEINLISTERFKKKKILVCPSEVCEFDF